jgi:hypothetical protein
VPGDPFLGQIDFWHEGPCFVTPHHAFRLFFDRNDIAAGRGSCVTTVDSGLTQLPVSVDDRPDTTGPILTHPKPSLIASRKFDKPDT